LEIGCARHAGAFLLPVKEAYEHHKNRIALMFTVTTFVATGGGSDRRRGRSARAFRRGGG